jgi:hypothetical protein
MLKLPYAYYARSTRMFVIGIQTRISTKNVDKFFLLRSRTFFFHYEEEKHFRTSLGT